MTADEIEFANHRWYVGYAAAIRGETLVSILDRLESELNRRLKPTEADAVAEGHTDGHTDHANWIDDMADIYGPPVRVETLEPATH